MRARSELRRSRPVSRTGATLVVLLATLVHLLACAHGPAPTGVGRADAILTAPANCDQAAGPAHDPAGQQTDPAKNNRIHCWGIDEPTVQPPRTIAPAADAVPNTLPGERTAASANVVRAALCPEPRPDVAPVGQSRARLGVWRT